MSLMDRIRECNDAEPSSSTYLQLLSGDMTVGWINPTFARRLTAFASVFSIYQDRVILSSTQANYQELSDQVNSVLRKLYDEDQSGFGNWCGEMAPVVPDFGNTPLFEVERCAAAALGILTTGVHLNGFIRANGSVSMWVARRARHLAAQPGKLDQIVAGFLSAGVNPMKN